MDIVTKRAIAAFVAQLDPQNDVVLLEPSEDFSGGRITFSPRMRQHRRETLLSGEKYVEAYLAVKLATEGQYAVDRLELQKSYEAGHPTPNRPRVDIIVNRGDGSPFMMIEAKDPDEFEAQLEDAIRYQLYALADHERAYQLRYLAYYAVSFSGDAFVESIRVIDFQEFPTWKAWQDDGAVFLDTIPSAYGEASKAIFVNKQVQDLAADERRLNSAAGPDTFAALGRALHDVLWGGGGMSYNDIFTNLVKVFLAKIYDEETCAEGQPFRFQILARGNQPETPHQLFDRINSLFKEAQRDFLGIPDEIIEEGRGIDVEKISRAKVFYLVKRLQEYSLVKNTNPNNGDILGGFFEKIVETGFKQSRGQFFTHHNIVQFMIAALQIPGRAVELVRGAENRAAPRLPLICDPSCGSGTFLIEAMKSISASLQSIDRAQLAPRTNQALDRFMPPSKPNIWADQSLYGIEINSDLSLATKVNMVLHGDGNINIYALDGLAPFEAFVSPDRVSALAATGAYRNNRAYNKPVNENFDFIVTNPPFSIKPDEETNRLYEAEFTLGGTSKSENLFLERWFQLLRPGGKFAAVLPESVMDTATARTTRLFLLKYFRLDAVVSLPYLAFKPYTSTKTCIVFATKKSAREVELYHDAEQSLITNLAIIKKRALDYQTADNDEKRRRKRVLIGREPQEVQGPLANIIGAHEATLDGICARLDAVGEAFWSEFDDVQYVFAQLAAQFNYPIFFSDATEVGYKRRRQGADLVRENDLFSVDQNGYPEADPDGGSVLDLMLSGARPEPSRRGFYSELTQVAAQPALRCDPKYRWFWDQQHGNAITGSQRPYVPLSRYLTLQAPVFLAKGALDEERSMVELEDVQSGTGVILNVQTTDEVGSQKLQFGDADILLSKLEPYLGKSFLNPKDQNMIGSTEWIPIQVADGSIPEFWAAVLISPAFRETYRMLQSGKRHARLSTYDFLRIRVPEMSPEAQRASLEQLSPLWRQVDRLRTELAVAQQTGIGRLADLIIG